MAWNKTTPCGTCGKAAFLKFNQAGGRWCTFCHNEKSKRGKDFGHDASTATRMACVVHGPHYVKNVNIGGMVSERCVQCRWAAWRKNQIERRWCNTQCGSCERANRREEYLDNLEALTAPSLETHKVEDAEQFFNPIKEAPDAPVNDLQKKLDVWSKDVALDSLAGMLDGEFDDRY